MRHIIFVISAILLFCNGVFAQQPKENWTSNQLLDPAILAAKINKKDTKNLVILCIGPDALIKGSVDIGPGQDQKSIKKLENYLKNVPKNKDVIIYCGCCPYERCPNVRPAFKTLLDMGFKNGKLLDLPKNIKTNWLDKNYPTND